MMNKTNKTDKTNQMKWLSVTLSATVAACGITAGNVGDESSDGLARDTSELTFACGDAKATAVTASDDDGNVPGNTVDGKTSTRWSCLGKGCSITYDLGASASFCGTGIAWYNGSSRKNTFTLSLSEDGQQFQQVFSGVSSGTTSAAESYAMTGSGRFLKITVNGNTSNDWASITEVTLGAVSGGGGGGGGTTDKNGVLYQPIAGFQYVSERFDWTQNFKSDGSMRHDFHGAPDSNQCVVGYFLVDGPDDEEISAKLASGPHNDDNPTYADTYDIGIVNFTGTRSRLRFEKTHPDYTGGINANIHVGDIRNKFVGAMGCKLNLDTNGDGNPDTAKVLGFVDTTGLDAAGKPNNNWIKTLDLTIPFSQVLLKSPGIPYVVTIGKPELAQATVRVDEQDASYRYKFIAYRKLAPL
jgi:hypothetical protein